MREIHPGFEIQGRRQQKSKTGVSVAPRKEQMSSKNKKKERHVNLHVSTVSVLFFKIS